MNTFKFLRGAGTSNFTRSSEIVMTVIDIAAFRSRYGATRGARKQKTDTHQCPVCADDWETLEITLDLHIPKTTADIITLTDWGPRRISLGARQRQ